MVTALSVKAGGQVDGALESSVRLGCYSPFVGVKYYTLLDSQGVAEGKTQIGAAGWHVPEVKQPKDRNTNAQLPLAA